MSRPFSHKDNVCLKRAFPEDNAAARFRQAAGLAPKRLLSDRFKLFRFSDLATAILTQRSSRQGRYPGKPRAVKKLLHSLSDRGQLTVSLLAGHNDTFFAISRAAAGLAKALAFCDIS